jgi:hypothetical protein
MRKFVKVSGVDVFIGDKVRFINDSNLYQGDTEGFDTIVKPKVGKIYEVRGFSDKGGLYLVGINNQEIPFNSDGYVFYAEPGFATWRFAPFVNNVATNFTTNVKIEPQVEERVAYKLSY